MVKIHISFRFHGNFYHSYRGDTPDELGFGKDIRIIRNTIKTLDELNAAGIPIRGTWDFENYFSLERIMPEHCPDIIEGMKRRVSSGMDEIEYMSYNNGLVSASTHEEFDAAMGRAVTNAQDSGLKDLFGNGVRPIVRPQEMMFTPSHLKYYAKHGIKAISLFYSSIPFNGFSTFIKPLSIVERYNPLTLIYPGIDETMTLLPCYNAGDLLDNLGLKNWAKRLRRHQLKMSEPKDLLLIIDMDADDEFWAGFNIPVLSRLMATAQGLNGIVKSVAGFDFIEFTTPGRYLDTHEPAGAVSFGQDTADGSFDGLSSWAEKWDNHILWTGIERSRILELQARHLFGLNGKTPEHAEMLLGESFDARLKALSTTHFGMSAPVMNITRLDAASALISDSVARAGQAFDAAIEDLKIEEDFIVADYARAIPAGCCGHEAIPTKALVRIPASSAIAGLSCEGEDIKSALYGEHLYFRQTFMQGERKSYTIKKTSPCILNRPVELGEMHMDNGLIKLEFDGSGNAGNLIFSGSAHLPGNLLNTSVTYGKETISISSWSTSASVSNDVIGVRKMAGSLVFDSDGIRMLEAEREIILAAGLPYVYVNMTIRYPETPHRKFDKRKAARLQQSWDDWWKEVMPCEIAPGISGTKETPLKIWKHNYFGDVSSYLLDYAEFSANRELDSFNNQITHAWTAVSNGSKGILMAYSADACSGMAFCPMRTRLEKGRTSIRLNPFGSYSGRQWSYPTAYTGLGKLVAVHFSASDHIRPYAPSYNGRVQKFSLMIAPYDGDCPPEDIRNDALAFSYPFMIVSNNAAIGKPSHRTWDAGL